MFLLLSLAKDNSRQALEMYKMYTYFIVDKGNKKYLGLWKVKKSGNMVTFIKPLIDTGPLIAVDIWPGVQVNEKSIEKILTLEKSKKDIIKTMFKYPGFKWIFYFEEK